MAFTLLAVGASAAISSPRAKSPPMASRHESARPPRLFGTGAPKAATLAMFTMARPASAMHSWTTTCAASSQDGGTGVVDRRRRMPSSR